MFAFPPPRARLGVEARAPGRCVACIAFAPSPDGEARMGNRACAGSIFTRPSSGLLSKGGSRTPRVRFSSRRRAWLLRFFFHVALGSCAGSGAAGGLRTKKRSIRDPGFDSDSGRLGAAFAFECGFGE